MASEGVYSFRYSLYTEPRRTVRKRNGRNIVVKKRSPHTHTRFELAWLVWAGRASLQDWSGVSWPLHWATHWDFLWLLSHTRSRCTWLCTAGSHPSPVNHNVAKIQPLLPLPFTRTPCLYTGYRQRKVNGCDRGHSGWTEPSIIQPGQSNIRSESSSLTHKPQKREGGGKKKVRERKNRRDVWSSKNQSITLNMNTFSTENHLDAEVP